MIYGCISKLISWHRCITEIINRETKIDSSANGSYKKGIKKYK